MKILNGRKLQKWRRRLNIKQSDLAAYICCELPQLQRLENMQYLPRTSQLRELVVKALSYFEQGTIFDLRADAFKRHNSVEGCTAMVQVMTTASTTDDFWQAKKNQALANMRIVDSLRFVKGALPNEKLFVVEFQTGNSLRVYGNLLRIVTHVHTFYGPVRPIAGVEPYHGPIPKEEAAVYA